MVGEKRTMHVDELMPNAVEQERAIKSNDQHKMSRQMSQRFLWEPRRVAQILRHFYESPVSLPGGQIYENLVSGAIDATEWVGPWNDRFMKFYEAAKYYYYPGMHEPGSMLSFGMNASWWGGLSKSDQIIVEAAASMENDVMMSEYNAKSGEALDDLIKNQGVKLRKFNDDTYDAFGEATAEVFEGVRAHSPLAAKIDASFRAARADLGAWSKISDQAYVAQRTRVLGL